MICVGSHCPKEADAKCEKGRTIVHKYFSNTKISRLPTMKFLTLPIGYVALFRAGLCRCKAAKSTKKPKLLIY